MFGSCSAAGDFDPRFADVVGALSDLRRHLQDALGVMSSGHGAGFRAGPWGRGPGRTRGRTEWPGFPGPWGGGPWPGPPRGPKAARGDVRAAILALLGEGPRNGYQIMSEIEERSNGAWRPSPGAVYPALQQLADEGLVEAEESGGRRTFSLTDAGRRYVEENPERARAAWESMADSDGGTEIPGLFAQAARLGGSIVQMAHAGTPEQVQAAEALLDATRRRMYQILAGDTGEEDGEEDGRP
jgi:DNA-binding PadR family transcriptional regulator